MFAINTSTTIRARLSMLMIVRVIRYISENQSNNRSLRQKTVVQLKSFAPKVFPSDKMQKLLQFSHQSGRF